jgi:signal transduction histidine kinase/CheY-like chemotaxis protein
VHKTESRSNVNNSRTSGASSSKLSVLSTGVIVSGAMAVVIAVLRQSFVSDLQWLTMVALVLFVAPITTIHMPRLKAGVTIGDAVTFTCAALFGPDASVIAAAADGIFSSTTITKSPRKILYNTSMSVLSMVAANTLTQLAFKNFGINTKSLTVAELAAALGLFTLVYFSVSTFLIAAYLAVASNESFWKSWKENCMWTSISYAASGVSAMGAYLLVDRFGYYSFIIPVGLMGFVYLFYRVYFQKVESAHQRVDFIEQQLRQSQKMEAVGRLAGGVAHDFNNLLTAILIYSDLILNALDERDPLRKQVEEIQKAGNRAASLTRQLLAFSRKQILQPKIFNLNTTVRDMKDMMARLIGEDIELVTSFDRRLNDIEADPGQIEQVMMNLIINARDAMPQGGQIIIETTNISIDQGSYLSRTKSLQPGEYVQLSIRDTGCGMDSQTASRIFDPFFTTKDEGKGTGLGLSTVYGIITQSGGHIEVESEPDKGATFRVYLPGLPKKRLEKEESDSADISQSQPATILLVEDEEMVRGLLRTILKTSGYTVIEAGSGQEALALCEHYSAPIHLMVTDVVMPHMSGRELAERLTESRPGLKVLYISGHTDDAIFKHGVMAAEMNFLQKPFLPDDLLGKIRELLFDQSLKPPNDNSSHHLSAVT